MTLLSRIIASLDEPFLRCNWIKTSIMIALGAIIALLSSWNGYNGIDVVLVYLTLFMAVRLVIALFRGR